MSDIDVQMKVGGQSPSSESDGVMTYPKINLRRELCVIDFFTQMALEGRAYNITLGTITTPVTGDINLTDAAAEACTDAGTGLTIMPVYLCVDVESVNGGTLSECAAKGVGAVSSAGTVAVALPLLIGGSDAMSTSRMNDAGGVTVASELVTTTRVYFSNRITAQADFQLADHYFRVPPTLKGPACFYLQVAGTTAGPTYFACYDFIEMRSVNI